MLKELLFGRTQLPLLRRGLDALDLRQKAIANNIANAQTEGYKRQVVSFEHELQGALRRVGEGLNCTHPDHLSRHGTDSEIRATLRQADKQVDGPESESVIIEREMADLAQNQIRYEAEVRLARQHLELLKSAIRGHW